MKSSECGWKGAGKRHSSGKRTGIEGLVVILVLLLR